MEYGLWFLIGGAVVRSFQSLATCRGQGVLPGC